MAGRCYTELHRPRQAEPLLTAALDTYDDSHAREAALYLSWLAEDHLQLGDIDEAAAAATRALTLACRINSDRSDQRVRHLHDKLAPHDTQTARDFRELYAGLQADTGCS